jgi:hypothetical protein
MQNIRRPCKASASPDNPAECLPAGEERMYVGVFCAMRQVSELCHEQGLILRPLLDKLAGGSWWRMA